MQTITTDVYKPPLTSHHHTHTKILIKLYAHSPNPSLRAQFGKDGQQNCLHGSDSRSGVEREINLFFPGEKISTSVKAVTDTRLPTDTPQQPIDDPSQ